MDNAIKYGNGEGITVNLSKEEDGYYFVIRNKGKVLSEKELPYIFNSFWRGSNAEKTGGNGIGLFESRKIAQSLYGDIYVKANEDENEMEFDIYIPDSI
jgi:signal transduction histidine kinase